MTEPHRRDWGRILLVSVLALSLLGNALAIGGVLRLWVLRDELLGPATAAVVYPSETRAALRAAFAAQREDLVAELQAMARQRSAVVAAAAERPFDRARVALEMTTLREEATALLARTQGIILDTLEAQARK